MRSQQNIKITLGVAHKMCQISLSVILSKKCFIIICPIINHYITMSLLMFQDSVHYCTTAVNHAVYWPLTVKWWTIRNATNSLLWYTMVHPEGCSAFWIVCNVTKRISVIFTVLPRILNLSNLLLVQLMHKQFALKY